MQMMDEFEIFKTIFLGFTHLKPFTTVGNDP